MNQKKLQIPEGMQDTLPGECVRKRSIEGELRTLFALHGYQEIETPCLEYYQALDDATYGYEQQHVWKTFDQRGNVLAFRPDSTIPAVRLAAGKLKNEPLPLRLSYMQNTAVFQTETVSALCEQPQAGVELMGEGGPQADAEIIALSIEAMSRAGLKEFQVELGQVGFFKGFMQEAGLTGEQGEVLRGYVEEKNMLAMQLFLRKIQVSEEVVKRLMRLPQLYGDESVLEKAAAVTNHSMCRAALNNLKQVLEYLRAYGVAEYVSVDLGMVHRANYYSGMIFRGMTGCLGQPLLSGGRYDGLPGRFGREMPATGFALSLKLLLMALERQGERFSAPAPDILLGFDQSAFPNAIEYAGECRRKGAGVALQYGFTAGELLKAVRAGRGKRAVYVTRQGVQELTEGRGEA